MSFSPQALRIWLEPGKNILLGFTLVAKNAIVTVVVGILGSKTPLAVLRCLLSTTIVALMLLPLTLPSAATEARGPRLPESPEVRGQNNVVSLTLHAVQVAQGKKAFAFNGKMIAPVIRVQPGDTLKIAYVNDLATTSNEPCATGPCMDMTNLHFHGLTISPRAPQDDALTMLAMPGQTLHYVVEIPKNHPPGLYWYHPHPHGESHRQVLDGMSGAIVVEGMERYVPMVGQLRERILVLRGSSIEDDPSATALRREVAITDKGCGAEARLADRIFTVNGAVRPQIEIASGERQFWRIVNASADRYLDLALDGQDFEIVAMDGMPLAVHDPERPTRLADHVLLPPAGRLEAIVSSPAPGTHATLRTRCVNTGPAGDPNPGMVLADIVRGRKHSALLASPSDAQPPLPGKVDLQAREKSMPDFVVNFTEDKNGFYINGQRYAPDSKPMLRVKVGTYQHWRIANQSDELHPMHIHQTHFLAYAVNGERLSIPEWLDTVNVPARGTVDVIMDFTNPLIKGMSLFHCHLLNHEDKGMMAKISFE
jgi:suppressor of ftsI